MEQAEQKVALITGAGSGIGRATALYFAARGMKIVAADLGKGRAEATVAAIEHQGGAAFALQTEVADETSAKAMVAIALDTYGRLDYAFNNAGIEGRQAAVHEMPAAEWGRVIGVNLTGVFHCMKYELAEMAKNKRGAIVNNASIAGLVGFKNTGHYTASKHGLIGLTKAAALDYAALGIRINALCPGVIRTEMIERAEKDNPAMIKAVSAAHPMQRVGQPDEVAELAYFLCTSARFITGAAIPVDGGYIAQ
jgi:NAD(P)-dependent dehydrogenase (short-subunit alcohol dehydrogenase family)